MPLKDVRLTSSADYGSQDRYPRGSKVAYPECGRKNAGGRGTFDDPVTMAAAPGQWDKCEVFWMPYLYKYVRFEDKCIDCGMSLALKPRPSKDLKDGRRTPLTVGNTVEDVNEDGKMRMSIWMGTQEDGGLAQRACQKDFASRPEMPVVRNPKRYKVDPTPMWSAKGRHPCRLEHRYVDLNEHADRYFCMKAPSNDDPWVYDDMNSQG